MRQMRHAGRVLTLARRTTSEDGYIALCAQLFLPRLRRVVMRADWDAVGCAWIADVLGEAGEAVPAAVTEAFAEECLTPRLAKAVDAWAEGEAPLHTWIHPWLPVVGRKSLGEVLGRVRVRVVRRMEGWGVQDGTEATDEVVRLVERWSGVLSRRKLQMAVARHVTRKMVAAVEGFCGDAAAVRRATREGACPEGFEMMRRWSAVASARVMGRMMDGVFVRLCRVMRGVVFGGEGWEVGARWYKVWKGWVPERVVGHVRGGLGAVLFVVHAGRVEGRATVRERLSGADVRGLVRNRFVGGKGEAVRRWREGRVGLKEAVEGVARREGLVVVGEARGVDGVPVVRVGRVRVALDGRRGVVAVVTDDGVRPVGLDELVRLAR